MNIPIYPGSSSFFPGQTPFGFYDNDYQFQQDADKVALFCARRLGFPIMEVELQDVNFYTAFEEAITAYGNEVYAYQIRQNYLDIEGSPTSTVLNNAVIQPNFSHIIRVSQQYAEEAGVGGNVEWKRGLLPLTASVQDYDLNQWAINNNISSGDIEIKRIFYEAPPSIVKFFDPYAGTGAGMINMLDSFGWGNYSPAINFVLMPLNFDLQRIQQIELNDQIRKSNYSFEITNNKLRIFPIPNGSVPNLAFQYILKSERNNPISDNSGNAVSNVSNVPYANPTYTRINSVGRQWIFEYTLALCKEMLGYIRGKYSTVPIPNSEVTLNQSDLITAATSEKTALIERLRLYLDETSRDKIMERKANESDYRMKELNNVPYLIYLL
jgi:hypothetical protein